MPLHQKATFSICAIDRAAEEVGCAVQSRYFAVGSVVPWARAGVGAVATQAAGVAAYGPRVLALLEEGAAPGEALTRALADDPERETRQLGVVAADGRAASHTGSECLAWAGHRFGQGYAVQGNILVGEAVVTEMERAFLEAPGSLAERLVASLEAGQAAGGDSRGQQSAAIVVERVGAAQESREGSTASASSASRIIRSRSWSYGGWSGSTSSGTRSGGRASSTCPVATRMALRSCARRPPGSARKELCSTAFACFESLAGETEEALAHLARSLELDPGLRAGAVADSDFDAVRQDIRFAALVR